jgi:hypothetical protein
MEHVHYILDRIEDALTRPNGVGEPARHVHDNIANLQAKLALPTYMQ